MSNSKAGAINQTGEQKTFKGRFRPSADTLHHYSVKSSEALVNASEEDLGEFTKHEINEE